MKAQYRKNWQTDKHRNRHTPRNGLLLVLFLFLLPLYLFPASSTSNADELLQKADAAVQAENWDTAAALLEEGIARYPTNELFQLKLGDMYFSNGLYEPAYRRFTEGLRINRYNIKLLYGAASAAAALNKAEEARGLLPHILCIMCIQVLRDGCVGVSEARCNIDGFGARLNQARCVGVAEAVRVESQLM